MTEQVYKKVKNRYVPIGYSDGWSGFPTDGIWLVQTKPGHKSSECIMKIGDIESMQPTANLILGYKDKIIKFIQNNEVKNESPYDLVNRMLIEITK